MTDVSDVPVVSESATRGGTCWCCGTVCGACLAASTGVGACVVHWCGACKLGGCESCCRCDECRESQRAGFTARGLPRLTHGGAPVREVCDGAK
jgi:hypothetical protein